MKKAVKRFVYFVLSLVFLAASVLGVPRSASAATFVPLCSLAKGDTVNFADTTWVVIDPVTGYLILPDSNNYRSFDPDNTNTFDPGDSNNIAYYLNNTFYNSLPPEDSALILNHNWTIGNELNESSVSVICKIGLVSYSELYNGIPLGASYFWSRTPSSQYSDQVWMNMQGYGLFTLSANTNNYFVFPTLYLNPCVLVAGGNGGIVLGGNYHTIRVLTSSSAGGTATGGGIYANGASVTITATPGSGYGFLNWTDENGSTVSTSSSYSYTMGTADTILVANFQHPPMIPTITVVNGVPFSVIIYNTCGTLIGTNTTYGTLTGTASGNDTEISGTLSGLSTTAPTDIILGGGTIKIKAVDPPSTTLDNTRSFY